MPILNLNYHELTPGIEVLVNGERPSYLVLKGKTDVALFDKNLTEIPLDTSAIFNPVTALKSDQTKKDVVYAVYLKKQNLGYCQADVAAPPSFENSNMTACVLYKGGGIFISTGLAPFFPGRIDKDVFDSVSKLNLDDRIEFIRHLVRIGAQYSANKFIQEENSSEKKFSDILRLALRRATGEPAPNGILPIYATQENIASERHDPIYESIITWIANSLESICRGKRDKPSLIHKLLMNVWPEVLNEYMLPENALLVPVDLVRYEKHVLKKERLAND